MIRIVNLSTKKLFGFKDNGFPFCLDGCFFSVIAETKEIEIVYDYLRKELHNLYLLSGENHYMKSVPFNDLCWKDNTDGFLEFCYHNGTLVESFYHESLRSNTIGSFIANVLDTIQSAKVPRLITKIDFEINNTNLITTDQGLFSASDLLNIEKFHIIDKDAIKGIENYSSFLTKNNLNEFWNNKLQISFTFASEEFPIYFVSSNLQNVYSHWSKGTNLKQFIQLYSVNVVLTDKMLLQIFIDQEFFCEWQLTEKLLNWFFNDMIFVFSYRLTFLDKFHHFGKGEGCWSFWPHCDYTKIHFSHIRYCRINIGENQIHLFRPKIFTQKLKQRIIYKKKGYFVKNLDDTLTQFQQPIAFWKMVPRKSYSNLDADFGAAVYDEQGNIVYFIYCIDQHLFDLSSRLATCDQFENIDGNLFYIWKNQKFKIKSVSHIDSIVFLDEPIQHSFGNESKLYVKDINKLKTL